MLKPLIPHFFLLVSWFILALIVAAVLVRLAYAMSEKIASAPALDFLISIFTWIPWTIGSCGWGWKGFAASVLAEFIFLHIFCISHRILHRRWGKNKGVPTLADTQNHLVGTIRNQMALLIQLPAVFAFVLVRASEIFLYPLIAALAKLPTYKQNEWVNLSRHKFTGLVGYDLLWCWYCDWMTGLWSLGSEMLRNIESFWCPIQFQSPQKNKNASLDFPDVAKWAPFNASVSDVTQLLEKYYQKTPNSWWGHPDRNSQPENK